ncbi:hypothetical protein [Corallococcus terminator]|uniref:Uncharacterized protein n=1 Tax=Corallococcus terminator TaxID=2316733 RepID=A0A3A8HPZ3_9BACT|nr:hypothetical protein [Corallococcus terminator]RKG72805.1 hypothetical protein D7V88_37560 [Corallococcus terminator]
MVKDLPEAESAQPDCPLVKHPVLPRCDPRELQPLLDHLGCGTLVSAPIRFPIGTLLPDGRLDLCKQGLGVEGTQAVLGALRDHPHVSSLLLGTNGMGDVGAAAVAELVRHNPRIRTVYLGCNLIGPEGTRQLADAVQLRPSVEGLWLKRNPLGAQGTTLLADAVATSALRTLDLVDTGLGETGLAALVEQLLARDAPLEWLYLSGNRLTARAARPLAELLRKSPRLLGLYLAANPLGDDSAEILAEALAENRTLLGLSLSSTGLGPRGARALAQALRHHPVLESLELGHAPSTRVLQAPPNRFGPEGAEALAGLLMANTHLRYVDLRNSDLSSEGTARLIAALGDRPVRLALEGVGALPKPVIAAYRQHQEQARSVPRPEWPGARRIRSVYR